MQHASCLADQGQYAEAKAIEREVLAVWKRVLEDEHPDTLTSAGNLARSLSDQGKHVETEAVTREKQKSNKRKRSGR